MMFREWIKENWWIKEIINKNLIKIIKIIIIKIKTKNIQKKSPLEIKN
jgi:hypothetical protein